MIRKNGRFTTQIAIQIRDFDSRITVLKVIGIRDSKKVLIRPSPKASVLTKFVEFVNSPAGNTMHMH